MNQTFDCTEPEPVAINGDFAAIELIIKIIGATHEIIERQIKDCSTHSVFYNNMLCKSLNRMSSIFFIVWTF